MKSPVLAPEIDLLLSYSQLQLTEASQRELREKSTQYLEDRESWKHFMQLAEDHRLLPLIYQVMEAVSPPSLPADLQQEFSFRFKQHQLRCFGLAGELFTLLDLLRRNGVKAIPFKGLVLSQAAYGDVFSRWFSDIDLLVKPEDFFQVKPLLKKLGYQPFQASALFAKQVEEHELWLGEYCMQHSQKRICIDVHHQLVAGDCSLKFDFSRVWQRLEEGAVMGQAIPSLKDEDLFLYLCVNAAKDGWPHLKSVHDIMAFLARHPTLDWHWIMREAAELEILQIVSINLEILERLWSVSLPAVSQQIARNKASRYAAQQVCQRLCNPELDFADQSATFEKFVLRFLSIGATRKQMKYCWQSLTRLPRIMMHVTAKDEKFIKLPQYLNFLYILVRPIRILREHGFGILQVAEYRLLK